MMLAKAITIYLIVSGIPVGSEYHIKFYNTNCTFNTKYIGNGTCNLKLVARNTIRANVDYDLLLPMQNVTAYFKLFKFYNQFRPFLINEWINLCHLIKDFSSYNFFVKMGYRIVKKYSNAIICKHCVGFFVLFVKLKMSF